MFRLLVLPLIVGLAFVEAACVGGSSPPPESSGPFETATPRPTNTPRPTATLFVFPTATPIPAAPYESTRLSFGGKFWYLHGSNLPWFNWGCDFGCGANGGVSSVEGGQAVETALKAAKSANLNVVRWWMFPGEPSQFLRADDGAAGGLKQTVYQDIDAALRLAQQYDVYFEFVLFSAPTELPTSWTTDETHRTALGEVIGALAGRYATDPHILAWEVFNEPEWDVWNKKASEEDVVATVNKVAEDIHQRSPALVTVGSASIEALGMWADSKLDFYEPHWYDPMGPRACARCTDYATLRAAYGLKKPVVIGEFYADSSVDALQRYQDFYGKAFAGAWAWSLLSDRTADRLSVDLSAARQFGQSEPDIGPTSR